MLPSLIFNHVDCILVELPPEGDKADECPPREDHVLTAPENEGPRPSVTNQVRVEHFPFCAVLSILLKKCTICTIREIQQPCC